MQQGRPAFAGRPCCAYWKGSIRRWQLLFRQTQLFQPVPCADDLYLGHTLAGRKGALAHVGQQPGLHSPAGCLGGVGRGALGKGGQRHCGQCHAQRQNHTDEPFLHKILSFSSALQAGRFCCTQCTTFCPLWTVLGTNRPANALKRPGAPHAPAKNRKPPGLRLPDGFLLYRNYGNGILNRALLCACSIPRTAAKVEQFCVNGP